MITVPIWLFALMALLLILNAIGCRTRARHGYQPRGSVDKSHPPRGGSAVQNVTPSCGCILCDLKLPRAKDDGPGWQTFFHQTQHGPVPCRRNF